VKSKQSENSLQVRFDWNEEYKHGTLWIGETSVLLRGYANERQARQAAKARLNIMRANLGSTIPALLRRRK